MRSIRVITKESYRVDEVADRWDCARKTVVRLINRGSLSAFKVGSTWRIKADVIEQAEKINGLQGTL